MEGRILSPWREGSAPVHEKNLVFGVQKIWQARGALLQDSWWSSFRLGPFSRIRDDPFFALVSQRKCPSKWFKRVKYKLRWHLHMSSDTNESRGMHVCAMSLLWIVWEMKWWPLNYELSFQFNFVSDLYRFFTWCYLHGSGYMCTLQSWCTPTLGSWGTPTLGHKRTEHVHVHAHSYAHAHARTRKCTRTRTRTNMYTHTRAHTHADSQFVGLQHVVTGHTQARKTRRQTQ